jgi:hypothetical protein
MKTTKKLIKPIVLLILLTLSSLFAISQSQLKQTVKGIVIDADTNNPLLGATILVEGTDPLMGTISDLDGSFRFDGVPVGRHNFNATYVGYEPFTISEVLVGSGKEVVLTIELKESSLSLGEVVVKASSNKDKPVNTMATLSARTFSVEETSRYAGGLDDPSPFGFGLCRGNYHANNKQCHYYPWKLAKRGFVAGRGGRCACCFPFSECRFCGRRWLYRA